MMKALLVTVVAVVGLEYVVVARQSLVPPSVFTQTQAAAGKAAYESVCVNCHTYAVTGRKVRPVSYPLSVLWQRPSGMAFNRRAGESLLSQVRPL